jgi:agmatinase
MTFLGLDPVSWEDARAVILPMPYDSTSSYKAGSRHGPSAIIEASRQVELYDEETCKDWSGVGILTLPEIEPDMRGPGAMLERVYRAARPIVQAGKILVGLGGEHSLSLSSIKAVHEKFPEVSVLQIDAHLDLRNTYEETPFSHASVMRRVRDFANVVPVGIRNVSEEEAQVVKDEKIRVFYARDIVGRKGWEMQVVDLLSKHVFISIDVDGMDPGVIPATGTPEPGGLGWWETLRLLRWVATHRTVVGMDLMELAPNPASHVSEFAAARLAYKILCYVLDARAS